MQKTQGMSGNDGNHGSCCGDMSSSLSLLLSSLSAASSLVPQSSTMHMESLPLELNRGGLYCDSGGDREGSSDMSTVVSHPADKEEDEEEEEEEEEEAALHTMIDDVLECIGVSGDIGCCDAAGSKEDKTSEKESILYVTKKLARVVRTGIMKMNDQCGIECLKHPRRRHE